MAPEPNKGRSRGHLRSAAVQGSSFPCTIGPPPRSQMTGCATGNCQWWHYWLQYIISLLSVEMDTIKDSKEGSRLWCSQSLTMSSQTYTSLTSIRNPRKDDPRQPEHANVTSEVSYWWTLQLNTTFKRQVFSDIVNKQLVHWNINMEWYDNWILGLDFEKYLSPAFYTNTWSPAFHMNTSSPVLDHLLL